MACEYESMLLSDLVSGRVERYSSNLTALALQWGRSKNLNLDKFAWGVNAFQSNKKRLDGFKIFMKNPIVVIYYILPLSTLKFYVSYRWRFEKRLLVFVVHLVQ